MDFKELLLKRRSVRKFTDEPVSKECIDEMLHAAMSGPSACNRTPWEFYVVTDPDKLAELRGASHFTKIKAPLAIIVCGNLSRALPLAMADYWIQDCSAATENILLSAVDMDLGAVWCGVIPQKRAEQKVRETLALPNKHVPLNIIFIGHPAENPAPRDQYNEKHVHFI